MSASQYNNNCPVCLEEGEDMFRLSCEHYIHLTCAAGLTELTCPICRTEVANWPDETRQRIIVNRTNWHQEMEEEEIRELIDQQRTEREQLLREITFFINPPPQVIIESARYFLEDAGIPTSYMPRGIDIVAPTGTTTIPPNILFSAIVGQTVQRMEEDLGGSSSQSDEDMEDLFIPTQSPQLGNLRNDFHL